VPRPFSLFLALRYLRPKRSFVSVITVISILGVTLGIAVMIVVISVMQGFDSELQATVLGFSPEVTVQSEGPIENWQGLLAQIQKTPGVLGAAPAMQGPVIAEHQEMVDTPMMVGIDPDAELKVVNLKNLITSGSYDLEGDSVIMGADLADSLHLHVGDKVTITGPGNLRKILDEIRKQGSDPNSQEKLSDLKGELVMPADCKLTGIFESGRYEYDAHILFVPLNLGQELYGLDEDDSIHQIQVKTANHDSEADANKVKDALNSILPQPTYAQTWMDQNEDRFQAIRIERSVMFFILMFIVIVAAFGIMTTLITFTVQKTREIGVLKALGATTWQIVWVFMIQGMVVGFFGNLTGLLLGIGAVTYRNQFRLWLSNVMGVKIFPADVYDFAAIPAQIIPRDVAIICISGFVICSLAAFLPAWFAARLDPVKALRYE
jgi:lipoprotein-releasing system permease protein